MKDKVGYKKPPKQHQFKPGRSGNPGGRSKRPPTPSSVILKVAREPITVVIEGRRMRMQKLEAGTRRLVNKALEGDPRALKLLMQLVKLAEAEERKRRDEDNDPAVQVLRAAGFID